jgi:hypothetical protein
VKWRFAGSKVERFDEWPTQSPFEATDPACLLTNLDFEIELVNINEKMMLGVSVYSRKEGSTVHSVESFASNLIVITSSMLL